jgi:ferric-dicitrate binding protein FerR (iron transport regulator)
MQKNFNDDTFLARWLNGTLSKEELAEFENSEDFAVYSRIADTSKQLQAPAFNKEQAFQNLLDDRRSKKKTIRMPQWTYWVAASVAIIIAIFTFMPSEVSYTSIAGEQIAVNLPDGSTVKMNALSELSWNKAEWKENRTLNLKGEAFFKVKKGKKFTVQTKLGNVSVLGTQFTVHSRNNYFEVRCYEGKVKLEQNGDVSILTKGKAIRIINGEKENQAFTNNTPSWIDGETTFENIPLKEVLAAIQRQFDVEIDTANVDLEQRFTGSFSHEDLELALKAVCYPLEIEFKIESKKQVKLFVKE